MLAGDAMVGRPASHFQRSQSSHPVMAIPAIMTMITLSCLAASMDPQALLALILDHFTLDLLSVSNAVEG